MNVYNIQDLLNKTNTTANIQFSGPFNCPSIVFCTGASGGHWIVIEETRENYLIFDPYGTPPGRFYNIKNIPKDKPFVWSTISGQRLGKPYCGLYCVAFLMLRKFYDWPTAAVKLFQQEGSERDNRQKLKQIFGEEPDSMLFKYGFKSEKQLQGILS